MADQFDNLVERAVAAVPPPWNSVVGKPPFREKHREAWHRLLLTWEDDQEPDGTSGSGAGHQFTKGDIVLDSRCGLVNYGVVIQVYGRRVYYIDGCGICRDGRHHRCDGEASTTHKGRGRVRASTLRGIGSRW